MINITENDLKQIVLEAILQLKEELNEGFSSKIYHFTTILNFFNISKTGKCYLGNGNKTDTYINKNYPYYMSFTRERTSKMGYAALMNGDFDKDFKKERKIIPSKALWVRMEFDGDKLKQLYKGKPVNYHFIKNASNDISKMDINQQIKYRQSEDRLFATDNSVSLFKFDEEGKPIKDLNILTRVDILYPIENRKLKNGTYEKVKWLLTNKNSLFKDKIYLYGDRKSFDNIAGKNNVKSLEIDSANTIFSTENFETKFTENTANRLIPIICLLKCAYLLTNKNVNFETIIEEILSYYKQYVTLEKYEKVKNTVIKALSNTKIENYIALAKAFKVIRIKNTFKNDLYPIAQKSLEIWYNFCKNNKINTPSECINKLINKYLKKYNKDL